MNMDNNNNIANINKKAFGRKIKAAREKFNLTQFELAEKIGISPNFLGDIERGKKLPSLNVLITISNTLKISLDSLFSESLSNTLEEPEEIYYSDNQIKIISEIIKKINDNF